MKTSTAAGPIVFCLLSPRSFLFSIVRYSLCYCAIDHPMPLGLVFAHRTSTYVFTTANLDSIWHRPKLTALLDIDASTTSSSFLLPFRFDAVSALRVLPPSFTSDHLSGCPPFNHHLVIQFPCILRSICILPFSAVRKSTEHFVGSKHHALHPVNSPGTATCRGRLRSLSRPSPVRARCRRKTARF